jgi:hypothetical protein
MSESVPVVDSPLAHAELPTNEQALCQQFCADIAAHPANVGLKLALLAAVTRLWPHVGIDERARLRQRLVDSFAAITAPAESQVSLETLREWQSDLSICHGDTRELQPADLRGVLDFSKPAEVYRAIAERFETGAELGVMFRVVGTLAIRLRLGHRDQGCQLHHAILGTVAGEDLVKYTPPDLMADILAQLMHQVWWCRHHGGLEALPTSGSDAGISLESAVQIGDAVMARRAGRSASKQPEQLWDDAWTVMERMLNDETTGWPEALTMLIAIAWRTGHNVISPDDAGLLGMVFADPLCHGPTTSSVLA